MEYCSLSDAFPEVGGGPASTGCKGAEAGKIARKEERKKAKRCKGPPLTFLDAPGDMPVVDPDRPALRPMPEVPPLNCETGLRQHAPVDAPQLEPYTDYNIPRSAEEALNQEIDMYRSQQPPDNEKELMTLPSNVAGPNKAAIIKAPSFFGANFDDETIQEGFASFTNIIGDDASYRLSPDFTSAFAGKGADKASGEEVLPEPSVRNVWKPLTPSGSNTSFFDRLPSPGGLIERPREFGGPMQKVQNEMIQQSEFDKKDFFNRLDTIYARLDQLETRRTENTQTEVLMFIMSGIFVLFSMDILVRKTGNVRILNRK